MSLISFADFEEFKTVSTYNTVKSNISAMLQILQIGKKQNFVFHTNPFTRVQTELIQNISTVPPKKQLLHENNGKWFFEDVLINRFHTARKQMPWKSCFSTPRSFEWFLCLLATNSKVSRPNDVVIVYTWHWKLLQPFLVLRYYFVIVSLLCDLALKT